MLIYVAHKYGGDIKNVERATEIVRALQVKDTENCYICPLLALSHLRDSDLDYETQLNLCIDILSVCDKLLIASPLSVGVRLERDFAELVGMEIEDLSGVFQF